ncbi:MAG: hypothetical protein RBS99_08410, partial [Rhodospirillales bacterium]|nr:hypothetical protein [Rhodospirillales bacterium]
MADLQFPAFDEVEIGGSGGVGDNAFPAFDEVDIPDFDSVSIDDGGKKPRIGIRDTLKARSQQQTGVEPESTTAAVAENFPINRAMRSADQKALVDIYEGNLPDYKKKPLDKGARRYLGEKGVARYEQESDADRLAGYLERQGGFAKESVRMWRQFDEPKATNPEEREASLKDWIKRDAERELKDRIEAKRAAGKTLDEHERSIWNKMVVGAAENAGYMAQFTVPGGVGLSVATSAADRTARLSTDEYDVDDDGNLYLSTAGDDEGTAAIKGLAGAAAETAIEVVGGKVAGKLLGKGAGLILKGVAKKAPVSARLIGKVIKKYGAIAKATKLGDPIGETWFEEYPQALVDSGIGLDLKQSEMEGKPFAERMVQAHKDFDPAEVMLSMAFMMGGQAAMSTASATMDHATLNRNLDNSLKLFGGLEDADLKGVSTKDKILMARRVAGTMTPEKVEVLTRHLDAKAQQALKKAYDRQNFYDQAQAEGVEPTFTLGGDGKSPYVDTKSGIGIIPEGGKFRVVNRDGADVGVFNSAGEAIAEAKKQSQVNVVLDQQRQKKADYALKEAERLAGGMPVRVFNTEAEMLQEIPEIGESPDYQEGITGVRHKGGMVLVLDNLISPSEVVRTIMHEGGAHEGIRRALGDKAGLDTFLGKLGGKQFEVGKRRLKLGGQEFADQLTEADEALATVYENRLAEPTAYQKSVSWLHGQLRKVAPNLKYTDADIEVLMADAQQKVLRAEGGFDGAYVGPETGRGARGAVEQAQYDQDMLRREESFPKRQEQSQGPDIEPRKEQPAQAVNADKAEVEKVNERYAQENPQAYREAMQAARGDVVQANRIYEEITAETPEDSAETPYTPTAPTSPPQAPVADAQAANEPGVPHSLSPDASTVEAASDLIETEPTDNTPGGRARVGDVVQQEPPVAPEATIKESLKVATDTAQAAQAARKPPELMTPEERAASVTPEQYIDMALRQAKIGDEETGRLADVDRATVTGNAEEAHANLLQEMAEKHNPLNADAVETYFPKLDADGMYKDRRGNKWEWTGYKLPPGYVREGDRYVFKGDTPPAPKGGKKGKADTAIADVPGGQTAPPAPPAPQEPARPAIPSAPADEDASRQEALRKSKVFAEKLQSKYPPVDVRTDEIRVQAEGFRQFKEDADPATGVVEEQRLTGQPYSLAENPIVVMEMNDGRKVIVTGRHRLDLYKRNNIETIPAHVIRESDGWTPDDAGVLDAFLNILDEKGSIHDYVKFFDKTEATASEAESSGLTSREKGRTAFLISKSASPDVRASINFDAKYRRRRENGEHADITAAQAAAIAEAAPVGEAPENEAIQREVLRDAFKGMTPLELRNRAQVYKRQIASSGMPESAEMDLFGDSGAGLREQADRIADAISAKQSELMNLRAVLNNAINRGDALQLTKAQAKALGITNVKDKAQLQKALDATKMELAYWSVEFLDEGRMNQARQAAGVPVVDDVPKQPIMREVKTGLKGQTKTVPVEIPTSGEPTTTIVGRGESDAKPGLTLESVTTDDIDAEASARNAEAVRKSMIERAASPLEGNAGDLTADLFGEQEGETPLFNARRDGQSAASQAAQAPGEDSSQKPAAPARFPRGAMANTVYNEDGVSYTGRIVSEDSGKGTVTIRATKERKKGLKATAGDYGLDKQGRQITKDVTVPAELVRVIDAVDSGARRTAIERAAMDEIDREVLAELRDNIGDQTTAVDQIDKVVEQQDADDADPDEAYEGTRFRRVSDPKLISRLENGKKVKAYRAMQLVDGKLYPPMAAKVNGEWINPTDLNTWLEAEEFPQNAFEKNGRWYFKLDKGNGASIEARYNPYFHSSLSPLNDQFTSASNRPNLVTVEVEIPLEDIESGYKADKAKDAVGEHVWKTGPVAAQLPASKARKVILSRYNKVVRIVPDSEVAEKIATLLEGEGISIPENVVTPSLKDELVKRRVDVAPAEGRSRSLRASNATVTPPPDVRFRIVAYHGTPHTFEPEPDAPFGKVKKEKVGTGEGAAAYGWGVLYAAENKGVADTYTKAGDHAQRFKVLAHELAKTQGRSNTVEVGGRVMSDYEMAQRIQDRDAEFIAKLPESIRSKIEQAERGNLYTVELDFDPEDTLDWDLPLSEQSDKVRQALFMDYGSMQGFNADPSGEQIYRDLSNRESANESGLKGRVGYEGESKRAASERLARLGIKGIRYADQQSRGVGVANGRFKVERVGMRTGQTTDKPWTVTRGGMTQGWFATEAEARKWADEKNGRMTYNYVVFNESDIRVVGRNGETLTPTQAMDQQESDTRFRRAVTPEQDAAYLAAVEDGDMATAQRMVDDAARAAGYNIGPVWHGGADGFNVFSWSKMGQQGTTEGKGFYFSNDKDLASGYADRHGGRLMRVFLRSGKPIDGDKLTFTRTQLTRILRDIHNRSEQADEGSSPLWNFGDISYEGIDNVIRGAVNNLMQYSEDDVSLIGGLINGGFDPEYTYDSVYKVTGKTGIAEANAWGKDGHELFVATAASHVKLADPVTRDDAGRVIPLSERFNEGSNDIRFRKQTETPEFKRWFGDSKV